MEGLMNVEKIYRTVDGRILFVERREEVELVEPGNVTDHEAVHYGVMPDAVKAELLDSRPLFPRR